MGDAEDVFRAATDHGDLRFYLFEEWKAAGAEAPVVGHNKHVASQIDAGSDQTILDGFRDIRRQEKTPLAEGEFKDQRTVIGRIGEAGAGRYGWRRTGRVILFFGKDVRVFRIGGIPVGIQDHDTDAGNLRLGGPGR